MFSQSLLAFDFKAVGNFFNQGGIFMYALALTSFVALAAIVFKILSLSRKAVIPLELEAEVDRSEESGHLGRKQLFICQADDIANRAEVAAGDRVRLGVAAVGILDVGGNR